MTLAVQHRPSSWSRTSPWSHRGAARSGRRGGAGAAADGGRAARRRRRWSARHSPDTLADAIAAAVHDAIAERLAGASRECSGAPGHASRRASRQPETARAWSTRTPARARDRGAARRARAERLGFRVGSTSACASTRRPQRAPARAAPAGCSAGGTIWLDPDRYDPRRADGRALLAHEAAHVAQRAETRPAPRPPRAVAAPRPSARRPPSPTAVREGRVPRRPRRDAAGGRRRRGHGRAVAGRAARPRPDRAPRDPLAVYRAWQQRARRARRHVGARLRAPDRRDARQARRPWVQRRRRRRRHGRARAAPVRGRRGARARARPAAMRVRLVDNVSRSHRRNFRRAVLASYAGLMPAELQPLRPGAVRRPVARRADPAGALPRRASCCSTAPGSRGCCLPSTAAAPGEFRDAHEPAARRTRPSAC